jgi:hypothetical protein
MGCLADKNTHMTIWENQIIMLEIHPAKILNWGNQPINIIHHWAIVIRLYSHHFQALTTSTNLLHSTLHQAHNQALVHPKDIPDVGH